MFSKYEIIKTNKNYQVIPISSVFNLVVINFQDKTLSEYNDQPKITQMWDSILNEFIDGWPEDPSTFENNMIHEFLNASRYEDMMKVYLEEQIINKTLRTNTVNNKHKTVISCSI